MIKIKSLENLDREIKCGKDALTYIENTTKTIGNSI